MLDKISFAKGMAILTKTFPDYPCHKGTMDIYWEFLQRLSPQEFEWAITAHLKKYKWFPKISELLDEWMELRRLGRLSATEVWGKLLEAAGRGEKPEMDNITRTSLVAVCGGWEELGLTPTSELPWRFKEFERIYNAGWEAVDYKTRTGDPEKILFLDDNGKVLLEG
jgi:hypothetical protein